MRSQRGALPRQAQHRVFQPGKRHMELIASVSRSSGLEKDGDALRDPKVQEEYRAFIQGKVDEYWKRHPLFPNGNGGEDSAAARNRKEIEDNLLILFRKLREGLLSTQRRDAFALEVYETSLYLSVLFKSPVQTTSALSHLFPDLYISIASQSAPSSTSRSSSSTPKASAASTKASTGPTPPRSQRLPPPECSLAGSALASTLIFLLHHLVTSYPSQIAFHTHLRQLHPALQAVLGAPAPAPETKSDPLPFAAADARLSESRAAPPLTPFFKPKPSPVRPAEAGPRVEKKASKLPSEANAGASFATRQPPAAPSPPSASLTSQRRPDTRPSRPSRPSRPAESARDWLRELARSLRTRNYARLEALTCRDVFGRFVRARQAREGPGEEGRRPQTIEAIRPIDGAGEPKLGGGDSHVCSRDDNLALAAIGVLVGTLLEKARGTSWNVLRTAYREVWLGATPSAPAHDTGTTGDWLVRSLVLKTGSAGLGGAGVRQGQLEVWLDERCGKGEARRREGEGMDGRWILVKA